MALQFAAFASQAQTNIYTEFSAYLTNSVSLLNDGHIGIGVQINTYAKVPSTPMTPVIFYILNHSMERVGQENDIPIISDFLDEGYIVVTMDYLNHPKAISPDLDWSIQEIRTAAGPYLAGLSYRAGYNYVVPAGCRIKRDLIYWSIDKHASKGTFEYIVSVYNDYVVPKFGAIYGLTPAVIIEDCKKPDGSPIDLDLRMDIVYPSQPSKKVPVFMLAASSEARSFTSGLNKLRPHEVGFLMRGYASVCYDHEYIPMARADHYNYFAPFSLAGWNGVKTHTAAVRLTRLLADQYGYDKENIGVMGHSKSSYCSLLSSPNPQLRNEAVRYSGFTNETYGAQPWLTYGDGTPIKSDVQVCYSSMGDGTKKHATIVNSNTCPSVIACGDLDQYGSWDYWPDVQATYLRYNVPHLAMGMIGLGHVYAYGYDAVLGFDRYKATGDFFDYYLMKDAQLAPKVIYSIPLDKEPAFSMVEGDSISVKFTAPMDRLTIETGIKITDQQQSGKETAGSWTSVAGDTQWIWNSSELQSSQYYQIQIATNVADKNGRYLENNSASSFRVASVAQASNVTSILIDCGPASGFTNLLGGNVWNGCFSNSYTVASLLTTTGGSSGISFRSAASAGSGSWNVGATSDANLNDGKFAFSSVTQDGFYSDTNVNATVTLGGLSSNCIYNLILYGSRTNYVRYTTYAVGTSNVTLQTGSVGSWNSSQVVRIDNITPDAQGQIVLSYYGSTTNGGVRNSNGYLNAMEIQVILSPAAISSPGVILTDDFSDGNRTNTPNGGVWYKYGNTTLTTTSNLYMTLTTSETVSRGAELNFGAQTLSVGDKLSVSFDMMQNTVSNSADRVRIGLYDSNGTALTADTANAATATAYLGRVGYYAALDTRTNSTGYVNIRNTTSTQTQVSSISGQANVALNNVNIFDANWDSVLWSIERTGAAEYTLAISVNGGAEKSWVHSSGGEMTDTFDTFVLYQSTGIASFTLDNVQVSVIPEPAIIGMMGLGGVTLLLFRRRFLR